MKLARTTDTKTLTRSKDAFGAASTFAGSIRNLWWALTVVGSGAALLGRTLSGHPLLQSVAIDVAIATGGILLGLAPTLIRRSNRPVVLQPPRRNAALFLEHADLSYVVRRHGGIEAVETRRVKAVAPVSSVTLMLASTGSGPLVLRAISGCDIRGPLARNNWDLYQFVFVQPLESNQTTTYSIAIHDTDLEEKLKPFTSDTFESWVGVGSAMIRLSFPDDRPRFLFRNSHFRVSEDVGNIDEVFLNPQGSYEWTIPEVDGELMYGFSWVW